MTFHPRNSQFKKRKHLKSIVVGEVLVSFINFNLTIKVHWLGWGATTKNNVLKKFYRLLRRLVIYLSEKSAGFKLL